MNPLVSVIIPVYKVEKYLDRCVASIVSQTYENLEIILVDDGSPDNCPVMCDKWAKKDNRIQVIHKQNGGLSDARNAALDIKKGEYITFVDSDDMLAPNAVELLIETALTDNSDIVFCEGAKAFAGDLKPEIAKSSSKKVLNPDCALEYMFCDIMRWEAWGSLYKSFLFDYERFPKGRIFEDIDTIPRVVLSSKIITFINAGIYYYYTVNEGSIMRNTKNNVIVKYDLYIAVSQNIETLKKIESKKKANAIAGILEELLSRVHLAYSNKSENKQFIKDSRKLSFHNLRYIIKADRISLKRKVFMLCVIVNLSGIIWK